MEQTVITVAGITPPGPGKKQGKIIDTNGGSWNVWGDKLQNYRMGVSYEIQYEIKEFNNHNFNLISAANPTNLLSGGQQPLPLQQGTNRGAQYVPNQPGHQTMPSQAPQAWPGPAPKVQLTVKDEMIFVCGIMNNSMANANVNPVELTLVEMIAMVNKAKQAWRNTFGKFQHADDMNDELPDLTQ